MRAFASRFIAIAVLAAAAGVVAAPGTKPLPPSRKPGDMSMSPPQLKHMVAAVVLDKEGDLDAALREYERALEHETPEPAIYWNMADIERRRENYKRALSLLEKYDQVAHTDAQRAEGKKVADAIKATLFQLAITGIDGLPAVVFVDGARAGTSPFLRQLAPGKHVVDLVTAERYAHLTYRAEPMNAEVTRIPRPPMRSTGVGNVIIAASGEWGTEGSWRDDALGAQFDMPGRQQFPPGHYETWMWNDKRACSKLVFDAPREGTVLVYVDASPAPAGGGCQPITVTTQKVVLP